MERAMPTGLAILLSALTLSVVLLYWITRDRWNWSKGGRRIALGFGILMLIGAVSVAGWWSYRIIADRPQWQENYSELALGMTMKEVEYVKGIPIAVLAPVNMQTNNPWDRFPGVIFSKDFKSGQQAEDYLAWEYLLPRGASRIDADFDQNTRKLKSVECYTDGAYAIWAACPPLLGVRYGSSEDDVISLLGQPSKQTIDGVSKRMEYRSLNAYFYLMRKKVYIMGIGKSN
jgi:hypothetical protein